MPRRKIQQEYLSELRCKHPGIACLESYVNCQTRLLHKCGRCGYVWKATPSSVLASKIGCPKCAGNLRYNDVTFAEALGKVNPTLRVLGRYVNAQTPIEIECTACGGRWRAKPCHLLRGSGCPSCVHNQTSYIEQLFRWSLVHCLGSESVLSRDRTAIGKELDIFVPSLKLAVEPGSWEYGHSRKVDADELKRESCAEKGIRLIIIYDSFPTDMNPPFAEDCITYDVDLGQAPNAAQHEAVYDLMRVIGIPFGSTVEQWIEIETQARNSCRRKTHEEFEAELKAANPTVELVGKYSQAKEKVDVRCRGCGHVWGVDPYNITHGTGCPKCGRARAAKSMTRAPEEYATKLAIDNPSIELLERFVKGSDRLAVRCKKCGYEWRPLAYSLIGSYAKGCPHCGAIKAGNAARGMSQEAFAEKLAKNNPNVILIGDYVNSKTKTMFKCDICGNTWSAMPYSVLQGHGCPKYRQHGS